MTIIRDAEFRDVPAITAIFNDAIENSLTIWTETPLDCNNRMEWLRERQSKEFPVIVVEQKSNVLGFASYGPFRPYDGYRYTVELSIYLAEEARGKGLGKKLLATVIEHASRRNVHVVISAIEGSNKACIALHKSLGFLQTGFMPQVGFKKNKWLDLIFMQRML